MLHMGTYRLIASFKLTLIVMNEHSIYITTTDDNLKWHRGSFGYGNQHQETISPNSIENGLRFYVL